MSRSPVSPVVLALLLPSVMAHAAPDLLVTEGERSGYARTGRFAEVERLCHDTAAAEPRVRCVTFGRTPEGRPMLALVASQDGVLDAATARARKRPVILIQAGIHGGEIEGKDAGFWALRELLAGTLAPGSLSAVTLVFVPIYNEDGHERFGPNNRPNQRGPEEMGWRSTAQNLNLNRDYAKADAPETRAMIGLLEAWDPVLYVDIHTTDGAKFQHDLAITMSPTLPRLDGLPSLTARLSAQLLARLAEGGRHLPVPFYPSLRVTDDPTSGFELSQSGPRYSTSYAAARNRMGMLVELHSWKTYRERVIAAHDVIGAILERAVLDGAAWRGASDAADQTEQALGGEEVTLEAEADPSAPRMIDFQGYAYRRSTSVVSGQMMVEYDETRPQVWRVPYFERLRPTVRVRAPRAGYVVPVAYAERVAERLRVHGLVFETLAAPRTGLAVEEFAIETLLRDKPFEGRAPITVTGAWRPARRDLVAGALFVPVAQPRALLVVHLMDPQGPDSFVSWGFFNAAFESTEYMEDYVVEAEARRMLARDPALAKEFAVRMRDAAFRKSPAARLELFYRRHPAWDAPTGLAPVLRVDQAP